MDTAYFKCPKCQTVIEGERVVDETWPARVKAHKQIHFDNLADYLDLLQMFRNDGRGINCVRTLIMHLRRGEINESRAVYHNESDKIRSYADIDRIIRESLLA